MSFIIKIPQNIQIKSNFITKVLIFQGTLGKVSLFLLNDIYFQYNQQQNQLILKIFNKNLSLKKKKEKLNLYKSLIQQKIKGITQGFKIHLFLKGLGFKALFEKEKLILKLGFSHDFLIKKPDNININVPKPTLIILTSNDLFILTQFAQQIKKLKLPDSYKGKGILLKNEHIILKEGKKK